MKPNMYITKVGDKFSVRLEWRKEGHQLVDSIDDLIKLIRKEFG